MESTLAVELVIPLVCLGFAGELNEIVTKNESDPLAMFDVKREHVQHGFVAVDNFTWRWQNSFPDDGLFDDCFSIIQ